MQRGDRMLDIRSRMHDRMRQQRKREHQQKTEINRINNMQIIQSQMDQEYYSSLISACLKQLFPLDALKQIVVLMDRDEEKIQVYLKNNIDQLLMMGINFLPNVVAFQFIGGLVRSEIPFGYYKKYEFVPKVIEVIKSNIKDDEYLETGIKTLLQIAYYQQKNSYLQGIKIFCDQYFHLIKHKQLTLFLLSFLGKNKLYCPSNKQILTHIIQNYQTYEQQLYLIAFDIICNFIEYTEIDPDHLEPIIQICYLIITKRNHFQGGSSSSAYRIAAMKCLGILMEHYGSVVKLMEEKKIMLAVVNIIRIEPTLLKERAFRVMEGFTKSAEREEIQMLLTQVPDLISLLESEGLSSPSIYVREQALKIIFNCLQKYDGIYSNGEKHNIFRELLNNSNLGIVQTIDNLSYNNSVEVSSIAAMIYERYFGGQSEEYAHEVKARAQFLEENEQKRFEMIYQLEEEQYNMM